MLQWIEAVSEPFLRKIKKAGSGINEYVLYKIVDSYIDEGKEYLQVQCINTKAVVNYSLIEIIYDIQTLHGLHPIQGCFIGIEYGKSLRTPKEPSNQVPQKNFLVRSSRRYGKNNLIYQDRHGFLAFESIWGSNKEILLMDPRDIALSRDIITEFDASQAFCIGVFAGLQLANPRESTRIVQRHLKLVKW